MEGLDRLHLVHARLLYIISEMFREGKITDIQKLLLKQCIFQDDEQIFDIYEKLGDPDKIEQLLEALKYLAVRL